MSLLKIFANSGISLKTFCNSSFLLFSNSETGASGEAGAWACPSLIAASILSGITSV